MTRLTALAAMLAAAAALACADDRGDRPGADAAPPPADGADRPPGDGPAPRDGSAVLDGGAAADARPSPADGGRDRAAQEIRPDHPPPAGPVPTPWSTILVTRPPPPRPDGAADAPPAPPGLVAFARHGEGVFLLEITGGTLSPGYEDEHLLVFQRVAGDVELTARIEAADCPAEARFGVVARTGVDTAAAYLLAAGTGAGGGTLQLRTAPGELARTLREEGRLAMPLWVRVRRADGAVTAALSEDGVGWAAQGQPVPWPDELVLGLAVAAEPQRRCAVVFQGVSLARPARPDAGVVDAPAGG